MGNYAIKARFETHCASGDVVKWLSSTEGIAGWWSDSVTGSASSHGDVFHVSFPTTEAVFDLEVTEITEKVVAWHVPTSPPWWKGTTIRFELNEADEGETSLLFTHGGFDSEDPIIEVITPAWVGFINNLVEVAQTGRANPAVVN